MSSTLPYRQLNHRRDIRLLRIKSGGNKKSIEVELDAWELDSNVEYTALSYVWGNPVPPSRIICKGFSLPITRNLWEVLSLLREQKYLGLLWVDAVCINQQDIEEKTIQVNMMRDIYKRAVNVIFWLGNEGRYDKAAVRLMEVFVKQHPQYSDMERLREKSLDELGLPSHDPGWIGWASLLTRPWFGRIWIVQEFANASRSHFMSGTLKISSDLLVRFAYATGACSAIGVVVACHSEDIRLNREFVLRPFALGLERRVKEITDIEDTRIVDLWTRSHLLGATDPRDRVFALLSLQTAVSMDIIDYSKDENTVYREIACIALSIPVRQTDWYRTTPCNLEPSPFAKDLERTSRFLACKTRTKYSSTLPSWVPDWRPAEFRFVPLTRYFPGTAWFTGAYDHATFDNKILYISGLIVDRPSIIVDSMPYMEHNQGNIRPRTRDKPRPDSWTKRMLHWQIMCYLLGENHSPKYEFMNAFCRTMAFNALPNRGATPSADYITGFQALHRKIVSEVSEASAYHLKLSRSHAPVNQNVIYESVFLQLAAGRKFAITKKGDMAWVPMETTLQDRICFLAGCAVPFVIRPIGKSFHLLGDCYLHHMMCDGSITLQCTPQLLRFE